MAYFVYNESMKKIFYSLIVGSLFIAVAVHAEDNKPVWHDGVMVGGMMGSSSTTTLPDRGDREVHGMRHLIMASSTMMGSSTCVKFNRGLSLGTRGEDVKELQEMLREKGFLNASSTGFFGKMTKEAVTKFQKDGGINPSGFFGELSRKHHQKHCGEGRGRMMGKGDDKSDDWKMSSTSMPVPCMTSASASGCEHSNAFPHMMGSGTAQTLCTTKFDPLTGRPCKKDGDDDHMGTNTPPMMPPPATTTATTTTS